MALTASCPSCGAPVVFRSAASIFAVCEYCQSTLLRHDQALEDVGKMAALVEDRSPLQLGSEGTWQGVHFAVIGRIQNQYSQGLWNEWHVLFDDMRTGWLSEAAGEYVLSFLQHTQELLPVFADLKTGQRFVMAGRPWTVSNIEQAECIAGQGELPFRVGAGYALPAVDLRNGRDFATLDYSETPPLLFVGQVVDWADLHATHLRDGMVPQARRIEATVFRCASCGSPMSARSPEIRVVGCATCGAVVDASDRQHPLLSKALGLRDEKYVPRLPLGSRGRLDDQAVEVIGHLVRQTVVTGSTCIWSEYLLAAEAGRYRWLTESAGHWNVVDVLSNPPALSGALERGDVRHAGKVFRHFSSSPVVEVIQVSGEFTWRVMRGERNQVSDYIAPPLMLSRERSEQDLIWSVGRYVEPDVIKTAFALKDDLPAPVGLGANQPNSWGETRRQAGAVFWKLALLAILLQVFFLWLYPGQPLLQQNLLLTPQNAEETQRTQDFQIRERARKIVVRNHTSLDNNWLSLNLALVNKVNGAAWPTTRELAFYSGVDEGEGWAEGSRSDEVVFRDIPPGTYFFAVDAELAPEKPIPVQDRLEAIAAGAGWSNFVLLLIFLALFPLFAWMRHAAFEARRWMDSDHAPESAGDDEED